ncbi:MAG: DNA-3-methyladenine glycosylase family protein [Acidimicrobiales bacterium]
MSLPARLRDYRTAAQALAAADAVMAELVAAHGWPALRRPSGTPFEALARAIVFQQLAGAAATAIWGRLCALAGEGEPLTPAVVLAASDEALRAVGLSANKAASVRDLAARTARGELRLGRLGGVADEEVIARLTTVRGIGVWSAQMFLMFQLRRLDVWPVLDLGVRNGYGRAYGLAAPPTPKELEVVGERFRPHRSVAAWYCWRAAETVL